MKSVLNPNKGREAKIDHRDTRQEVTSPTENDIFKKSYDFSKEFFSQGIKNFLSENNISSVADLWQHQEDIEKKLDGISTLFCDILTVPKGENVKTERNGDLTVLSDRKQVGKVIYGLITNSYQNDGQKPTNLLKIEGPVGCYKNRLLQYVYLYFLAQQDPLNNQKFPIIYIDCAKYERPDWRNATDDIETINHMVDGCDQVRPIVFFDNVRGFRCGCDIYDKFEAAGFCGRCKKVVSVDTSFSFKDRNRTLHKLFKQTYGNEFKISSLNLIRKEESEKYIKKVMDIIVDERTIELIKELDLWSINGWRTDMIREKLLQWQIVTIDAYQLKKILECVAEITREGKGIQEVTLTDIYKKWVDCTLENPVKSKQDAYKYEYGAQLDYDDFKGNADWRIMRGHKSILDYIIAEYYISIIKQDKMDCPNVVFSKNINRFIVPAIVNVENGIICKINNYYKNIQYQDAITYNAEIPKLSQYAFFLGRMKKKSDCTDILKRMRERTETLFFQALDDTSKSQLAFLLRSIYVSLIFQDDRDALNDYCTLLLKEEFNASFHRDINIGFHLDYYGDTINLWPGQCPPCKNDPNKGHNTLRKLKMDIAKKLATQQDIDGCLVLDVLTFCMMLQNRERISSFYKDGVVDLLLKFLERLEWENCLLTDEVKGFVQSYVAESLRALRETEVRKWFNLPRIKREGWRKRGVENPENVVEHTYSCWLIGYVYLPNKLENFNDYNKSDILTLLLIHDIGEVVTGDIISDNKTDAQKKQEEEAIWAFLSITQETNDNQKLLYREWIGMNRANEQVSVNAKIAKEIDLIQRTYQYFDYYADAKIQMLDENRCIVKEQTEEIANRNIEEWLDEICNNKITTAIGRTIRKELILNNPKFKANVQLSLAFEVFKESGYSVMEKGRSCKTEKSGINKGVSKVSNNGGEMIKVIMECVDNT